MDRSTRSTILFLFWFIFIALQILPTIGEGGQHYAQNQEEKPSIAKIVTDAISIMKESHESSWNKIKAIIKQVHLQISPPNLDFRGKDEANPEDSNAGGKMKEAAENSFGTSKHTVEESAKSAAKVVGEAMHKKKEKVKESLTSDKDESDAEL
ncbi:uncharacterized protein LOC126689982 [Quercus robur]|uniref:uncharacterized protein LOC126689982 n=1 Tax=Quercus robur TaxID=38942 RepID=UPI0021638B5D|nr:uncharacterized protein LOC126689982 [Quercus robur]